MSVIGKMAGLDGKQQRTVLRARIGYLLRTPLRRYRLNYRTPQGLGRAYSDEAIDAGEVLHAFARCTRRQQLALTLCLGRGLRGEEAARVLGVSRATVNREIAEALERMRRRVWEES